MPRCFFAIVVPPPERGKVSTKAGQLQIYLKFVPSDVNGAVLSARLRLFCEDPSDDAGSVYRMPNAWTETGITSATAPAFSGDSLAAGGAGVADTWVELDVTSAVQNGDTVSFALKSASTNSCMFSTREGVHPAQLVVQFDAIATFPPSVALVSPSKGKVGTEVVVMGSDLIAVTEVAFNGTPASFVLDSPTRLRATVPSGASTGRVSVANSIGTGASTEIFDVLPATAGATRAFFPTADAHVHSGNPTSNYGAAGALRARRDSTDYQFYLKFAVDGIIGPVRRAKVRLHVANASPAGGSMVVASNQYSNSAISWTETGITWSNAPVLSGSPLSTRDTVETDAWVEFDVTRAIIGNGTYSFGVTSSSTNSVFYSSKEGTHPPVLELEVDDTRRGSMPGPRRIGFDLLPAHPNPFVGTSAIEYSLMRAGHVQLTIYTVTGKVVRRLVNQERAAGFGREKWDGTDAMGRQAPAGLYLYRLEFEGQSQGGKLLLRR